LGRALAVLDRRSLHFVSKFGFFNTGTTSFLLQKMCNSDIINFSSSLTVSALITVFNEIPAIILAPLAGLGN
jgi:hypothetical protein